MKKLIIFLFLFPLFAYSQNFVIADSAIIYGGINMPDTSFIHAVKTPTTDYQAANKKYVDDNGGAGGADSLYQEIVISNLSDTSQWLFNGDTIQIPTVSPLNYDKLLSGSIVWDSLLYYSSTWCKYYLNGVLRYSLPQQVQLDAAHVSLDRIDVIALDTNNALVAVKGLASANPQEPLIDPVSQLYINFVYIEAGATTPGINTELIYNEGVEWDTASVETNNNVVEFLNTDSPKVGSYCTKIYDSGSGSIKNSVVTYSDGTAVDYADNMLVMYMRTNSRWHRNGYIYLFFYKDGSIISSTNFGRRTQMWGFDDRETVWQLVAIPLDDLSFNTSQFDSIAFKFYGSWTSGITVSFDYIELQDKSTPSQPDYNILTNNDLKRSSFSMPGDDAADIDHAGYYRVISTTSSVPTGVEGVISAMYQSDADDGMVYLLIDEDTDSVFVSTDKGSNWTEVSGGMPAGTDTYTLVHDGSNWVENSRITDDGNNINIGTAQESYIQIKTAHNNATIESVTDAGVSNYFLRTSGTARNVHMQAKDAAGLAEIEINSTSIIADANDYVFIDLPLIESATHVLSTNAANDTIYRTTMPSGGGSTDTIYAKYVTTAADTASAWKGNTDTLLIPIVSGGAGLPASVDGQMYFSNSTTGDTVKHSQMHWSDSDSTLNVDHIAFNLTSAPYFLKIGAGRLITVRGSSYLFGDNLSNMSGANDNVGFGLTCLNSLTNGDYNTANGTGALKSATSARYNMAAGYLALEDITTTQSNTAVGAYAGANYKGTSSLFLGRDAGRTVINGDGILYIANATDGGTYANTWIYGDANYDVKFPNGSIWLNNGSEYGTGTGVLFGLGNSEIYESSDGVLVIKATKITIDGDLLGALTTKSYSFTSQGIGSGTYWKGGFYLAPATDANLDEGSTTQAYGTANVSYAAHGFIVAGGVGTTDAGVVGLRVTGTSITDAGVRTATDADTISTDITTLSANDYLEAKKFIGAIVFELITISGSPTAFSLDFNYGYCKYEDFGNHDFEVKGFEAVGLGSAADASFNITLFHHTTTGWTYSAAAFEPDPPVICDLQTDHNTEYQVANGVPFAYKRFPLSTNVIGSGIGGVIVRIVTGQNNTVQAMDCHIGVKFE